MPANLDLKRSYLARTKIVFVALSALAPKENDRKRTLLTIAGTLLISSVVVATGA